MHWAIASGFLESLEGGLWLREEEERAFDLSIFDLAAFLITFGKNFVQILKNIYFTTIIIKFKSQTPKHTH